MRLLNGYINPKNLIKLYNNFNNFNNFNIYLDTSKYKNNLIKDKIGFKIKLNKMILNLIKI